MAAANLRQPSEVGIHRCDLSSHVGEHLGGTEARGDRDHLAATSTEAEPMHGTTRKMDESSWRCRLRLATDPEIDLALHDKERLVPGMTVRRRAAALRTTLEE